MQPDNHHDDISDKLGSLHEAIISKCYPRLYNELRRFPGRLSPEAALPLLKWSLDFGLTRKAFEAILEHSAPVPEILSDDNQEKFRFGFCGLLEDVVFSDRADILSLFLERGANPNRRRNAIFSSLEAALTGASLKSTKILLRQPELDTAWTDTLLGQWARPRSPRSKLEACIRAMAPRFTGWDPDSGQPLPIPEPMTPELLAQCENWPLLERFCRERGPFSQKTGRSILEAFRMPHITPRIQEAEEQTACAGALAALLDSCPGLLRRQAECRELLRCFLSFGGEAQNRLRPWVESLRRRRIAMDAEGWYRIGYDKLPDLWRSLLPDGPTLVVDRWDDLVLDSVVENHWFVFRHFGSPPQSARTLGRILDLCPVRGKGRKGELSPLARTVLHLGDPALIELLLRQNGGLLATEDPGELIYCALHDCCPRANCAAVLAFVHKETGYEL